VDQSVSFDDLLLPISVDNGVKTLESSAAHVVTHTLLLNPKSLDLIINMKEKGIVTGRIIAGPN